MGIKRHKPEEIVAKLRQVDVLTGQGKSIAEAVKTISVWSAPLEVIHVNDHGNGTPDFTENGPLVETGADGGDRPGEAGRGCAARAIAAG